MANYKLISEYQVAIRAMRDGKYDLSVPTDHDDEVGRLGHDLNELAQELERKLNESSKIQEIFEEISAGLFLDDVMSRIYDSFRQVIPYQRMGCALLSSENKALIARWEKSDASRIRLKEGYTAQMARSSLQGIIETDHPRILNDLESYLAEHPDSVSTRLIVEEGMRSSLTCPLIAQGKPVGFLFFSSMEKNTYQHIHQGVFLRIAGQLSILIEKSQLYQQIYELNQKLLVAQHALEHQATHDALTGIYNRGAIDDLLDGQISRACRHHQPLSIILLDVDHFKKFNDTHGHLAGDAVLKAVADRMQKCLRDYDFIGRFGGEEFLIVLGDAGDETAMVTAERLRLAVGGEPVAFDEKLLTVTISAGVAIVESNIKFTLDQIVAAADQALYKAKSDGRNRIEVQRI